MRFKTLFAVCALFGSLFQSSPSLSETLRTAWLGEHEAFLTWYAKEKGWDKEAGLDIIMLRFDSGKSLIENVRAYDWAIAGCGAVPAMQATMSDQVEVIAIANDESSANMILTRPESPILAERDSIPNSRMSSVRPNPSRASSSCAPKKRRPAICSTNGSPRSGLRRRTSRSRNWNRHPPSARSRTGTAISSPSGRRSPVKPKRSGSKLRRIRRIAVQRSPCSLSRIARSRKGIRTPYVHF